MAGCWSRAMLFEREDPAWGDLIRPHGHRSVPGPLAGIDEAGRGPWAGPVVAAAVVLDPRAIPQGLADSKTLSPARREVLAEAINASAQVGVGIVGVADIDRLNILAATFQAMQMALAKLPTMPRLALIDGNRAPALPCPSQCLVKGDARSPAIAAASIVAKVTRDQIMTALAAEHPAYGWERNKGYGTRDHAAALESLGPTLHHRRSFRPVAAAAAAHRA